MALRPNGSIPLPDRLVADPGPAGLHAPNLAGAGATTRLDVDAATAPGRGMAAVGQGLQQLGNATIQLAQKKQEADAVVAERKAALLIQQANADVATAVAGEADQSKWADIATDRMNTLQSELAAIPNVGQKARELIDYKFSANQTDVVDGLEQHAAKKSLADAAQAIGDTVADAGLSGDEKLADATIAGGVERKLITPEQGRLLKDRFARQVEETKQVKQKESILAAVRENPELALGILKDDKLQVNESVRAWGINVAQQGIREATGAQISDMENEVAKGLGGALPNPEAVDGWAEKWEKDHPGQPKFSPAMKATARAHVARMNDATAKATMAANGPQIASQLWTEVDSFDPKTATREDYLALKARIGELPTEMQKDLREPLEARWNGTPAPQQQGAIALGERILTNMFRSGSFGPLSEGKPVMRIPMKDGKPVEGAAEEPAYDQFGKQRFEVVPSGKLYQRALADKAKAGGEFRRWLATNPNADEKQIREHLWQTSSDFTRGGTLDTLDAQKAQLDAILNTPAAPAPVGPGDTPPAPVESDAGEEIDSEEEPPLPDDGRTYGSGGGTASNVSMTGDLSDNPDTVGQENFLLDVAAPSGAPDDLSDPDAATAEAIRKNELAALRRKKK